MSKDKKNNLTVSETGKTKLIADEGQIDGIYDDPSGYATFGVGHLVKKSKSYLIQGAQSDETLKTKLGSKKIGSSSITYVPNSVNGKEELTQIKEKATAVANDAIAQADYKKKYAELTADQKTKVSQKSEAAIKEEADLLGKTAAGVLTDDLKPFADAVNTNTTGIELTQDEFDALVSFAFNVGTANFKSSTLLKKINEGKYRSGDLKQRKAAISEVEGEFKKWNKSGGKVLDGLTKRRAAEAERFLKGAQDEAKTLEPKPGSTPSPSSTPGPGSKPGPVPKPLT
ncbi:MAG: glycoside hydrolase family protein [Planctomycetes bacterium]|nr:glycoside hydrolase family protein [Planctomycetota bacterium]